ncbi:MAG: hypothetical protein OEZ13_07630 [Spirochaetia bacterium]|nr:hypothetical protein [Spirochaetia bacterium]
MNIRQISRKIEYIFLLLFNFNRRVFLFFSFLFIIMSFPLFSENGQKTAPREEVNLKDTLFEKIVWQRKVSHIALEESQNIHRVTLLMIMPYPYNYKSQNYAIYYEFENLQEALEKLHGLDKFLKSNGVMRVKLNGSKIISEEIIFKGHPLNQFSLKPAAETG